MPSAYCGECGWQYRAEDGETGDCSRAMIDHFVETGHSPVERCDAADRLSNDEGVETAIEPTERGPDPSKKR
ncbi:hypothetical protein [Natrinema salsiterrestre]|uniref:Uncharacterized protein n=1 Tax=Natrinema salsiterrestre TaxID=2950540 RepID=A0A9Q4KZT6_9EURY|nr:hypothetical protein [Natrinema salsiterrestre]MDF9744849.1 hypothetical protein [Natrinema salsiterrestre]